MHNQSTHVQQLLHVLVYHLLGLLVKLIEQAGSKDLLVGHRCPEDAHSIAQVRVVGTLERRLAGDDVKRELLVELLLLCWLDSEVLEVRLPRFALQRPGELTRGGLSRAPCFIRLAITAAGWGA